ncbi:hypothetical protein [Roseibium sp.]|uniref:hypothetical protein n=1 Tax=Roseibium sp. TaxID=1936156 RepID=UPI003D13C7A7
MTIRIPSSVLACLAALPLVLLPACSHVPLATMVKLADFDLLKTDPESLRIAVKYPDRIRIPDGGAKMMLAVRDKTTGKPLQQEDLAFQKLDSKAEKAELQSELQAGYRLEIYRLPEEKVPAFRAFQAEIASMSKAERDAIEGSMEIGVDGCLVSEEKPDRILVSTFLKADGLGGFVPLLRNVDLEEQMTEDGATGVEGLGRCESSG